MQYVSKMNADNQLVQTYSTKICKGPIALNSLTTMVLISN